MLDRGPEKPAIPDVQPAVEVVRKNDTRKRGRFGLLEDLYAREFYLGPPVAPRVPVPGTEALAFELPLRVATEYLLLCQDVDALREQNAAAAQLENRLAKQLRELRESEGNTAASADTDAYFKLRLKRRRTLELCYELQRASERKTQLASEVALESRGWKRARAKFSLAELLANRRVAAKERYKAWGVGYPAGFPSKLLDHPEFFLGYAGGSVGSPGPVAVVAHLYRNDPETIVEEAARLGLLAQFLPDSCYFPGRTLSVVYTKL